jgi:hypothetical protein
VKARDGESVMIKRSMHRMGSTAQHIEAQRRSIYSCVVLLFIIYSVGRLVACLNDERFSYPIPYHT